MHFQCKALASPFRLFIPATLEPVREPGTFSPPSVTTYGLLVHSGSVGPQYSSESNTRTFAQYGKSSA